MQQALHDAGLSPSDIKQVKRTRYVDATQRPRRIPGRGRRLWCTNTSGDLHQGVTGHPLGAAGALEAAAVLLSFEHSLIPPTANTTALGDDIHCDVVMGSPRAWTPGPTISNNFGFGGHNGSIILAPAQ